MSKLGGHALFLGSEDIQLGTNESLRDTSKVLCRFNDGILARVFEHSTLEELAKYSTSPIINALSDLHHPLQTLADIMTVQEAYGSEKGVTVAWIGDGNNVIHSLLIGGAKLGMNFRVATPVKYECNAGVMAIAEREAALSGSTIMATSDPLEAVHSSDVIVTDTWVSMGQESEKAERLKTFEGYQVTEAMAAAGGANPDWKFLHCLPRKPEEVDNEVFYSDRSLVWDEAENRMWTVMAVIMATMGFGDGRV